MQPTLTPAEHSMAHPRSLTATLSRLKICSNRASRPEIHQFSALPYQTIRHKTDKSHAKKWKARSTYIQYDIKKTEQFALLDAMHYIRAFEVGQNPIVRKYEVHVRLRSLKNGPAVRNRIRLPFPVKTDIRICVIAAPDSKAAAEARAAGAVLVGEDEIFEQVKNGVIEFERCICHVDSLQKLNKAGLGKQLGPKGLMPSAKLGTVVTSVGATVRNMVGASEYRERFGVVRMAVGQLGFTPEELQANVKAFMDSLKKDMARLGDRISKDVHEVVLSSTGSPGFTLSGEFRGADSIAVKELSGPL